MAYTALFTFLGLFFIYLEFFLPGMISALLGAALIAIGAIIFYSIGLGSLALIGYLCVTCTLIYATIRLALYKVKKSSNDDTFMLSKDQQGFAAFVVDTALVGREGVATTDLKPSGLVEVDNTHFQAISSSFYIVKGEKVKIVAAKGSHYVVEALKINH
jgi:membrane-bound serine protease (ClpP class)